MSSGVAGGIGFLVLIPLSLAALVSVPTGIYLSIVLRKDIVSPLLSVLTILMLAEVITEAGSVAFYNATAWVYGFLVIILEASWFLVRRWRVYAT
jgi:Ca2+/Na+ antiporter